MTKVTIICDCCGSPFDDGMRNKTTGKIQRARTDIHDLYVPMKIGDVVSSDKRLAKSIEADYCKSCLVRIDKFMESIRDENRIKT